MNQNKISVLLPVYNTKASHLKSCLNSIFLQTFQDFELIIVDNESTNKDTIKVLDSVRKVKNIQIIKVNQIPRKKNLSVALNKGILQCNNELIARMDSDDIMFPERLEEQLNYFNNNWEDVDILGTKLITSDFFINPDQAYKVIKNNLLPDKIINQINPNHAEIVSKDEYKKSTHFCNHPTIMFKKSVIIDLGGYQDEPDYIPEDYCLWSKALKRGYNVRNLQKVMLWYRADNNGLSAKDSKRIEWYQAISDTRNSLFDFKRYI